MAWDSSHFKINIARINKTTELNSEEMRGIDQWCLDNKINCLYFLKNNDLEYDFELRNGFSLVDTRVELKKTLKNISSDYSFKNEEIKLKKIKNLSTEKFDKKLFLSFKKSRFYQDKNFNKNLVTKMYQIWVENHINAKNAEVITAHLDAQIIGLITYELPLNNIPKIGLFSVKNNFGNLGIGSKLMNECMLDIKQRGQTYLSVVTQNSNKKAIKFYLNHGFQFDVIYNWFHKWYS